MTHIKAEGYVKGEGDVESVKWEQLLYPRLAKTSTHKGIITMLYTSAREITDINNTEWSKNNAPEHPTRGQGATWAPGVQELLTGIYNKQDNSF